MMFNTGPPYLSNADPPLAYRNLRAAADDASEAEVEEEAEDWKKLAAEGLFPISMGIGRGTRVGSGTCVCLAVVGFEDEKVRRTMVALVTVDVADVYVGAILRVWVMT